MPHRTNPISRKSQQPNSATIGATVNGVNTGLTGQVTASDTILQAIGRLAGDDLFLDALMALGSTIKANSVGLTPFTAGAGTNLTDGEMRISAVYLPKPATLTGVAIIPKVAGNFTGDNTNSIALYSYSVGVATKVAETANDQNIWKNTANTFVKVPFSSTYVASAGIYFVSGLYNNSVQSAAPQISFGTNLNNAVHGAIDFTNSARLNGTIAGQTSQPATFNLSSVTAGTGLAYFALY